MAQWSGTYYGNGNTYLKYGNRTTGCSATDLSFYCEFGSGVTGNIIFNRCRYYDPSPDYNCIANTALTTRGWRCALCCKGGNSSRVPACSLNYARLAIHEGDDTNIPEQPRARRNTTPLHCSNGTAAGNLCNQASGSCNDYCCKDATSAPCLTPLCPLVTSSSEEDRQANLRTIRAQCERWRESTSSTGQSVTLTWRLWREWNHTNQQITTTRNGNRSHSQRRNLEACPVTHTTWRHRCCIGLANGGEYCYPRRPRN